MTFRELLAAYKDGRLDEATRREVEEAIDREDPDSLREELGDVLLHVVFHAGIETDAGRFSIDDVCDTVVKKMISRHPALFGGDAGLTWDEIKRQEKGLRTLSEELESVATSLPALWRAEKLQGKAEQKYPPPDALPTAEAVLEAPDPEQAIGELLYAAVSLARKTGVDPEQALHRRCDALLAQARREENMGHEPQKQAESRLNK